MQSYRHYDMPFQASKPTVRLQASIGCLGWVGIVVLAALVGAGVAFLALHMVGGGMATEPAFDPVYTMQGTWQFDRAEAERMIEEDPTLDDDQREMMRGALEFLSKTELVIDAERMVAGNDPITYSVVEVVDNVVTVVHEANGELRHITVTVGHDGDTLLLDLQLPGQIPMPFRR